MAASNLVIVESPAKAKTINKYLGSDFKVIASYGHVRDLPAKDGSVRPDDGFAMEWQMNDRAKKQVNEIVKLAKQSSTVYLATDPDREGEAISWHIAEIFKDKKMLGKLELKRVAFNEITKTAVKEAFDQARDIDNHLVEAYLARRALDYLVGFTLSPILWRKLPGSRSAGRVQSVALRLVCEREREIEVFKADEYWSIETRLETDKNKKFSAKLHQVDGERLKKLDIKNEDEAAKLVARLEACKDDLNVSRIEKKQVRRNPPPPFITSTLQQEASRKLGFGATKTMRTAQKLYEGITLQGETVGLITYMRTDGVTLSNDAISEIRGQIGGSFGSEYVPDQPRVFKSKAKNAQEAHEAIRPTGIQRTPDEIGAFLGDDERRLYALIWKRTMACQMANAVLDQMSVDITNDSKDLLLRATGSSIAFDGYYALYMEGKDDQEDEDNEKRLPQLSDNEPLTAQEIKPEQHFTQPPPRYTEATLVKKMEELGIGRPSTYASILQVLRDRNYVSLEKKRFFAENRGRVVTTFLANFFQKYVEYDFTANLENQLDNITSGELNWTDVLASFWTEFSAVVDDTKELRITDVINALDADLDHVLFPVEEGKEGTDPRKCPSCEDGRLGLKLGKFGGFIGCSNYPECKHTRPFVSADDSADDSVLEGGQPKELGMHPDTGMPVTLRLGPYGHYVQVEPVPVPEEPEEEQKEEPKEEKTKGKKKKAKKKKKPKVPKPKRMAIPRGFSLEDIDLAEALKLLALPREVGVHPESGEMIKAGIGRFGPYLIHQGKFKSIPKDEPDAVLTIGLNRAVDLLAQPSGKGGFGELRKIGDHPEDGKPVSVNRGRYGPYIKHDKMNASLPKDADVNAVTMDEALALLKKKAESDAAKGKGKAKAKPKAKAKKKTAAKKTTKKK